MDESRVLPDGRILRYNFTERMVHWVAGASYVYLLLTGLAFWTPWLYWMAVMLGGGGVSRTLHPWVGLLFMASVFRMYQLWGNEMQITDVDRTWWKSLRHYTRNEDENLPPVDRFNAGQKYLFWLMYWGGIALMITGVILWLPERIPSSLMFLLRLSALLHPIAALLTIGGFIIHVYMGTAVVRGGFSSVIRGEVSQGWAKMHHRLWLARITGNAPTKK